MSMMPQAVSPSGNFAGGSFPQAAFGAGYSPVDGGRVNREVLAAANIGYIPGDPSTYLDEPFLTQGSMYSDGVYRSCYASPNNLGSGANSTSGSAFLGSLACLAPPQIQTATVGNQAVCDLRPDPRTGQWMLNCNTNMTGYPSPAAWQ